MTSVVCDMLPSMQLKSAKRTTSNRLTAPKLRGIQSRFMYVQNHSTLRLQCNPPQRLRGSRPQNSNASSVRDERCFTPQDSGFNDWEGAIKDDQAQSLSFALLDSGLSNDYFADHRLVVYLLTARDLASAPRPAARLDCQVCCLLDCGSSQHALGLGCRRAPDCAHVVLVVLYLLVNLS
jgi:hypothetical protein